MKLKRSLSEYVRRYICFTISLFIMALGVAISTKSDLGTSPVSCVPYVLSLGLPLSMGVTDYNMERSIYTGADYFTATRFQAFSAASDCDYFRIWILY